MYDAMKKLFLLILIAVSATSFGQTISSSLSQAFEIFEKDSQLQNAISSLYVIDAKTGEVVFDKNSAIGLAPASTQKIITSATAYELLGKDFQYKTELGYNGKIEEGRLDGNLYLIGSGDPTLGSWRWKETRAGSVLPKIVSAIRKLKIKSVNGSVHVDDLNWNDETIPDGWIWQDIGNYYGAGAAKLNWRENQYDVILKSGNKIGDPVQIAGFDPDYPFGLSSDLKSAAKGTGDNAYIYYPLNASGGVIRGTIPVNENRFVISGSVPQPEEPLLQAIKDSLMKNKIDLQPISFVIQKKGDLEYEPSKLTPLFTHFSPRLDSIIYWFNKRSINLYGEALLKTIAFQKEGFGSTDKGVFIVKNFWKGKGIPATELNIVDGSGLSPLNRVTTHAQVSILHYAKKQPWFNGFYYSLPEYNGMKIKSGTINGVKGFCGYHTAKDGKEYIFSFLVNNYNGSASALVQKMYKVLDVLK
jgi:serine-type D-Ala-D-Ala carboxypeptidase/endopeptidase (penicillin-binding protein 4)